MVGVLLEFPENRIDLWFTQPEAICDDKLPLEYREILSPAERAQELRFRFHERQRQHLVARALVRTTLSRYAKVHPGDWCFKTNEYGRPAIDGDAGPGVPLAFSISHTRGLIVCGISKCGEVGVDVEYVDRMNATAQLAERCFAAFELSELLSLPPEHQAGRFFEYWTLKESFLKAIGVGLSLQLESFGCEFVDADGLRFRPPPIGSCEHTRPTFWLLKLSPDHVAAVCGLSLRAGPPMRKPRIREVIPLRSERELPCHLVRSTAMDFG